MATPLYYPTPIYTRRDLAQHTTSVRDICRLAEVECKASGRWTERRVAVRRGVAWKIEAAPGPCGDVRITIPVRAAPTPRHLARLALAALAYSNLFDPVARASIRGHAWRLPAAPPGRPRSGKALSNAERQRRFRARRRSA